MRYDKFFPATLRESKDFSVFIKLADKELSTIEDTITLMETLTNIDRTPSEFVKSIGSIIGFTYVDSYDEDVQRECIKSVWESRKEIGTHHALVMAATYGDIDGYLGGDLFIPGTFTYYNSDGEELPPGDVDIPETPEEPSKPEEPDKPGDPSKPEEPSKPEDSREVFTWSHSTFSGESVYAGPNINFYNNPPKEPSRPEEPSKPEISSEVFTWSHSTFSGESVYAGPNINFSNDIDDINGIEDIKEVSSVSYINNNDLNVEETIKSNNVESKILQKSKEEFITNNEGVKIPIKNRVPVEAIVVLPREYLFKWSRSNWSGNHKYAGPVIYKEGTILIELTRLNDKIKRRVESVKPAGMQVVYKYIHDNKEEIITHLK